MTFSIAPTPLVVDASAAVAFLAEDDDALVAAWSTWVADRRIRLVPAAFRGEVANALLLGKRLDPAVVLDALRNLEESGFDVADRGLAGILEAVELASRHRLTVNDAAYLWLAIDVDGELVTRDTALIRAAEAEGVPLALA